MGLFGILFFIILFAFLLVAIIGLSILSAVFGGIANILNLLRLGKTTERSRQRPGAGRGGSRQDTRNRAYSEPAADSSTFAASNGKIFSADEGTYVDFEEIKE